MGLRTQEVMVCDQCGRTEERDRPRRRWFWLSFSYADPSGGGPLFDENDYGDQPVPLACSIPCIIKLVRERVS